GRRANQKPVRSPPTSGRGRRYWATPAVGIAWIGPTAGRHVNVKSWAQTGGNEGLRAGGFAPASPGLPDAFVQTCVRRVSDTGSGRASVVPPLMLRAARTCATGCAVELPLKNRRHPLDVFEKATYSALHVEVDILVLAFL